MGLTFLIVISSVRSESNFIIQEKNVDLSNNDTIQPDLGNETSATTVIITDIAVLSSNSTNNQSNVDTESVFKEFKDMVIFI